MAKLTLYKASTIHAATDGVLSAMQEGSGRHIVIAPDDFTLAVEQMIAQKLGKEGIFHVEVMSFARLASVVLGDTIKKCLSPYGSVMLMEKVLLREEKNLKHYRLSAGKPGFAAEIYAAITSIRNSGVTVEQLARAASLLKGKVGDKTHDVALLYGAYLAELNLHHTDSTTRLEALIEAIRKDALFGDVHFSVVEHVDLNAKQREVVAALVERAASVSVAVAVGKGAGNGRIYPKLYDRLLFMAKEKKVAVREAEVPSSLEGHRAVMAEELFSYSFSGASTESIRLAEAKDVTEEITLLATEITRLVREEKLRYADIAVITPSFEEYLPQTERIFRRYGIPLFSDERRPLSRSDLFRHLLGAAKIVAGGYEKTLLKKYVTHALFSCVSEEEKACFCDYVDKSGVNYTSFTREFVLYREDPLYEGAEKVRAALMTEIAPLSFLPLSAPLCFYGEKFRDYLRQNDFDGKIPDYIKRVREAGFPKQAEIIRRTPAAFIDLLDSLEELRGEEEISLSDFILTLETGAEQYKIAALPVCLDCVYFAPVEQAMYAPISALFVLGAEEGLFPLEIVKEGILGPIEYAAWQGKGIEIRIENTGTEELAASRFHALQLLLRGKRLYLSHLAAKAPSPCFTQLAEIFSLEPETCRARLERYPIDISFPTEAVAEDALVEYSRRAREGLLGASEGKKARAIAKLLGKDFPLPYEPDRPYEIKSDLFFQKKTVNATELQNYFMCPFYHFVKNGLNAREKEKAERDNRDVGIIAHACMERFVRDFLLKKEKGTVTDEEARETAEAIASEITEEPRYRAIAEQNGEKTVLREIKRCGKIAVLVKNQIYASDFTPTFFERYFGAKEGRIDGTKRTLSAPSFGEISLTGVIDRVDLLPASAFGADGKGEYAVAVDYKTGSNRIDLKDLYFGKKVQLPLYLAVLRESGYLPIAALYASLNEHRDDRAEPYLYGPKLTSEALMRRLDRTLDSGRASYCGVSMKEGALKVTRQNLLVTEAQLAAVIDYALAVSEKAIKEIKEGNIRPSPYERACDWCEAKAICRHGREGYRDVSLTVGAEDLAEIMEHTEEKTDGID